MQNLSERMFAAEALALSACRATEYVRSSASDGRQDKVDGSPVTAADLAAQCIILKGLRDRFPEDRVAAEEGSASLADPEVERTVREALGAAGFDAERENLKALLDYRGAPDGAVEWAIDPVDGTKGFIKGLSYAIAVGALENGRPAAGAVATPNLPAVGDFPGGGWIWRAARGAGAWARRIGSTGEPERLALAERDPAKPLLAVGSRAHLNKDSKTDFLDRAGVAEFIALDGMGKYMLIANGAADLFFKPVQGDGAVAHIWDHCAAHIVVEEAGGRLCQFDGADLDYTSDPARRVMAKGGILAGHPALLKAVMKKLA